MKRWEVATTPSGVPQIFSLQLNSTNLSNHYFRTDAFLSEEICSHTFLLNTNLLLSACRWQGNRKKLNNLFDVTNKIAVFIIMILLKLLAFAQIFGKAKHVKFTDKHGFYSWRFIPG